MKDIRARPLTAAAFAPFGDVLDATGEFRLINEGMCQRHHDRAKLDFGPAGRAGISIFNAEARSLPYNFSLVERHPEGSQAFVPMSEHPFLVIVAPDEGGTPRHAARLCDQWRARHQLSPGHLAWRPDAAPCDRAFRRDRPHRHHRKP